MDTKILFKPALAVDDLETDFFKKVMGKVVLVPQNQDHRWLAGNIRAVQREIEVVERYVESGRHYPVENVRETSKEALVRLNSVKKQLEMADLGFPLVIPTFLSWTRSNKLPVFMTLSLSSYNFEISVSTGLGGDRVRIRPDLHPLLAVQYYPVAEHLLELSRSGSENYSISASFAGSIPQATKQRIEEAKKTGLFGEMYMIVEQKDPWKVQKKVRMEIMLGDPLIIGSVRVGKGFPDQFCLIDKFDLTGLEQVALRSHALDPFYPS
ncbi:MAG: hypothetical protein COV79_05445 [Parcubacteria group bacterium CG11_big_fil_rev_8_21_14_0_20_41_14]|nr:hypothetical protein [bacterium]PIQ78288.1 MAG: hypothetical protein COV79_05445 [Parcubacteria group bacterium CG11_big_fil_rev_8_21_14_0_20_41_14]